MDETNDEIKIDPKFVKEIGSMFEQINELQRQITKQITPEVNRVIRNKITDRRTVEHLLDRILDCASCDEGLALFKKLLRYYYFIDPETVAAYITIYREHYDDDYQIEDSED